MAGFFYIKGITIMSFEKGSFALTVFRLSEKLPVDALEIFQSKAAEKLEEFIGALSVGWVSGRHLLERNINEGTAYCGGHLYLNLRTAQRKVPASLLNAECRKEELDYMAMNKLAFVPVKVRRQIKKDIEEKRITQMNPQISGIPFVIDKAANMLYLGTSSTKQIDTFLSFFHETLKIEPIQVGIVDMMFRLFKDEVDSLKPVRFTENVEGESNPGRDFLTWLWYYSEEKGGKLCTKDFGDFELMIEGPLTFALSDEAEGSGETVVRKGNPLRSAEAKTAIDVGKKLKKSKFTIARGKEIWSGTIDADLFTFSGLNLPEGEKLDDLGSIFAERINYLHIFSNVIQEYFKLFANSVRSDKWQKEEAEIIKWTDDKLTC
jgi:recombination associated protein RdgC